jgi:dTDP-4-amino-4,6-dideoxygalactose transaminase
MSRLALLGGAPVRSRPFPAWPVFDHRERQALLEVLDSGKWWRMSFGEAVEPKEPETGLPRPKVAEFQERFARAHDSRYGVACANGTAAIEVALKALGVGPGDEVIVPPYTFIATASAVLAVNAVPVFADIQADTYNLDPRAVEAAVTPRTRAIIPVHFAGLPAAIGELLAIADKHGLRLIEDAAHAHGGRHDGRSLGSFGHAAAFSFQASKNMTAGEGGIVTTPDAGVAALCESYIWLGRAPGRPWYEHHRLGWNYRMTEFQAAILLAQLERLESQTARRAENAARLSQLLAPIPGLRPLRAAEASGVHAWHIYVFRFDEREFGLPRPVFLKALAAEGIPCLGGYEHPLYRNPMFLNQAFYPKGCPISCGHYAQPLDYARFTETCPHSEQACREAIWLEHRLLLGGPEDIADIAAAAARIHAHREELARL